jgi:formate hydrogenlyase subunit 3/multisubunit Na+/H+ antiporter MnhD subunit
VSLLPFLAIAFGAGSLALLTRRNMAASVAVGIVGLAMAGIAAGAIRTEAPLLIAGGALVGTDFARLFLALGCAAGLLLSTIGLATSWPRSLPGSFLIGLGAAGLALGVADAGTAAAAATAGAVAAILVTITDGPSGRGLFVAVRQLRAVVAAGALALAGTAVVAGPLGGLRVDPAVLGLAYLAFAGGVAIRVGAIPFHLWAARVADATPAVALPLVMSWGPAAFAVVGLSWVDTMVAPLGEPLVGERLLVALVGVVTITLGTAAAIVHDDLEHVVGYSIVADAGVALLGLAALDPAAWEPTRLWLLAFVAGKTAFAGWAAAARGEFGTRRISELGGWARRSPMLLVALLGVSVAALGWPGLAAFDSRLVLIDLALDGPLVVVALVGSLAAIAIYGRLVLVGFGRRSSAVDAAAGWRPSWPAERPRRISVSLGEDVVEGWIANRVLIAAVAVLALAGLAAALSAGGLGARAAAGGLPPAAARPGESFGPEESPVASLQPSPSGPAGSLPEP